MEGLLWMSLFVWLFVNTILAAVVSSHAEKRGYGSYFWLVFFLGVIGVLLYVADAGNSSNSPQPAQSSSEGDEPDSLQTQSEDLGFSAVSDQLMDAGEAVKEDFFELVFPFFPAGYADAEEWWTECIAPRLVELEGVERPTEDRATWVYLPADESEERSEPEERPVAEWVASPDSTFMHRVLGTRPRGILVEVAESGSGETGRFFIEGDSVEPESYMTKRAGEDWMDRAISHLQEKF